MFSQLPMQFQLVQDPPKVAAIGRMIHGEILSVVTFLSTAVVVIESAVTAVASLVTSFCSFINNMFTSPFKAH